MIRYVIRFERDAEHGDAEYEFELMRNAASVSAYRVVVVGEADGWATVHASMIRQDARQFARAFSGQVTIRERVAGE